MTRRKPGDRTARRDEVRGRLLEVVERLVAGAVLTTLSYGAMPPDEARANYDLFAAEVLPALHAHDVGGEVGVTHDALSATPA